MGEDSAVATSADEPPEPQVQVDLSHMMMGRIKEAPICVDEGLKKEAQSAEELSKLSFDFRDVSPSKTAAVDSLAVTARFMAEPSVISSGSSTASRESSDFSDVEGSTKIVVPALGKPSWSVNARKEDSERINLKVTTQKISRNGRQTQRWFTDPATQRLYRMTTGCVPIVEGGKILFVSSSRKPEWILPKGGWETDEAMEESAIRETFEEAGVLGIIGPVLGEIEYETRKAKKRRLEQEEAQRTAKKIRDAHGGAKATETVAGEVSPAAVASTSKNDGDTCSVASEGSQTYTHVRMSLFPLYVTEVRKSWPEEGRFRKAVGIDEAIRMTESRPEFQAALKELKERHLHIPKYCTNQETSQEATSPSVAAIGAR
jgi:diphosphoinositol-polyphosphate diphosphatase